MRNFSKTEMYHICFAHTQFNSFMNTLFKPLGLVEAQPRSAVEIKATVALEVGGEWCDKDIETYHKLFSITHFFLILLFTLVEGLASQVEALELGIRAEALAVHPLVEQIKGELVSY